jgi:hypothetical protein
MAYLVTNENKVAINPDHVASATLQADGSVAISVGANSITVPPGPDADKVRSFFGLEDPPPAKDAAQAKDAGGKDAGSKDPNNKDAKDAPHADPHGHAPKK